MPSCRETPAGEIVAYGDRDFRDRVMPGLLNRYNDEVFDGLDIEISAAYVWDGATNTSTNPNITGEWSDSQAKKLASNEYKEDNTQLQSKQLMRYLISHYLGDKPLNSKQLFTNLQGN